MLGPQVNMMEPLSPRSPNIPPKRKPEPMKTASAKPTSSEKRHAQKDYALAPPSRIYEPGSNGETYVTGGFLGKGGFAVCYEGALMRNNRIFAMKVVKAEMQQKKMQDKFRTELQIHCKMRHPNIVAFHRAFTFEKNTYVILELCSNGSVMEMVKNRKCLSLPEVRRFMVQLCGAVKYLHKRNVAHRDLKMGNMFLDSNMDIKVGDFGLAAIILSERDEQRRKTLCGTPNYIAPEVLDKSKRGHTQKVDIWSIGVIFFAMLAGYPPFQSSTQDEIYKKVKSLAYAWPKDKETGNFIPAEAKSLVSACLSLDEDERPEPDEIVDHAFFNMYPGCIPRQLERECRLSRPTWLKLQEPRGDSMSSGSSLENDPKYETKMARARTFEERYSMAKNEFYTECGVGKTAAGISRKPAGKRCSKTAWTECAAEEALGLQPLMPLPLDRVYCYHGAVRPDWSAPEAEVGNDSNSSLGDEEEQDNKVASRIQAARTARSQQALAAQLRRKDLQPKSHAALLRQPLPHSRKASREVSVRNVQSLQEIDKAANASQPTELPALQNLLSERPIRGRVPTPQGSLRERARPKVQPLPKSESAPDGLTSAKTRSQAKLLASQSSPQRRKRDDMKPAKSSSATTDEKIVALSQGIRDVKLEVPRMKSSSSREVLARQPRTAQSTRQEVPARREERKADPTPSSITRKSRSTLGLGPLIHPDEGAEFMSGTTVSEVMTELRTYLSAFRQRQGAQSRTRRRQPRQVFCPPPHAYVVKWVDYTNRYGIGYVLDDGTVGCIFKAEHGQAASCVLVRDGETHIRRKAHARESPEGPEVYTECGQLVPRNGRPVEFYESADCDPDSEKTGGIRRVLIPPRMFEVRQHHNPATAGERIRLKCEAEKVKRVKLVDQFGKYMIGSLGRAEDDEDYQEHLANNISAGSTTANGPYVKFYQRLGNVGIWGFGDGGFQFNFPDHTKVVIALYKSQTSPASTTCQIDFYHLAPSAARYLASKGKMHPTGFDTRSGVSEEASVFFSALADPITCQTSSGIGGTDLCEILEANSFREKADFIEDVLTSWVRNGRLGGKITSVLSRCYPRGVSASSTSSASGSSATTATLRSNGSGSSISMASTAQTSLNSFGLTRSESPFGGEPELFWDGAQERSWESSGGGKFVWVSVGAQGGDGEYMALVLKGANGIGEVLCSNGTEPQEELKERLKRLVSSPLRC